MGLISIHEVQRKWLKVNLSTNERSTKIVLTETKLTRFESFLDRLSDIDPSNIQDIVAKQCLTLGEYHEIAKAQARRSFGLAVIAACIGLAFFIAATAFLLLTGQAEGALISLISGALVEVIAGINFYLYNRTSIQLAEVRTSLETLQRFLLADGICDKLDDSQKQTVRAQLVRVIAKAKLDASDSEDSAAI